MTVPELTKEAQEIIDEMVNRRPPLMRDSRRARYLRIISLLLCEKGMKVADRATAIEAIKMVEDRGLQPFFDRWDDPASFEKKVLAPMTDINAYNSIPVKVKRWKPALVKPPKPPDQMKVLAFCASPRVGGNTDVLIDYALKGAREAGATVEKYYLQKLKMGFCLGCRRCKDPEHEGLCVIKDDMAEMYDKIINCDALVVGFPIYTARECAQLSTFLDRLDCFERFPYRMTMPPGKRAMVIGTWGYPNIDTYDHIIERVMIVLNLHKIPTYEAISACGFEGKLHGWDENHRAMILKYPLELEKAYQAGRSLVTGE
ncbi:MAG: flavodoxin family protein [Dehalococcoidia bacterium]|nr:flavodoxin family protein [Dehalococcoidia bacterium]